MSRTSIAFKPWSNTVQWLCVKMEPTTSLISHFFRFPSHQKLRKKWEVFCRRADEKFKTLKDPRICSQYFSEQDLKKTLSGKIEVISCSVPTISDPTQLATKNDPRKQRKNKRDRRAVVEHSTDKSNLSQSSN